jgi:hypothetical protein
MLGMCYIIFMRGVQGHLSLGNVSYFCIDFCVHCWVVFGTWFFVDGFLFPVKELGLLTNPSYWVRVLDVAGSYMYIVL